MRKLLAAILLIVLCFPPALSEDVFADDFSTYAEYMYGLDEITLISSAQETSVYAVGETMIALNTTGGAVTAVVTGTSFADVLTAACCVMRCVDNSGSMIDQYGRLMHAYFLARSRDPGMYHATTESSMRIGVSIDSDTLIVSLER